MKQWKTHLKNLLMTCRWRPQSSGLLVICKPLCALVYFISGIRKDLNSVLEGKKYVWSRCEVATDDHSGARAPWKSWLNSSLEARQITTWGEQTREGQYSRCWWRLAWCQSRCYRGLKTCCDMFMTLKTSLSQHDEVERCGNRMGWLLQVRAVQWCIAWTWQNSLQHSEIRLENTLVIMYNNPACELVSCDTFKWYSWMKKTKLITMENETDIRTI